MSRKYSEPEKLLLRGMGLPLMAKIYYIELQGKNPYYLDFDMSPHRNKGKDSVPVRAAWQATSYIETDILDHLLDCGLLLADMGEDGKRTGHLFLTDWGREFVNGALMNIMGAR